MNATGRTANRDSDRHLSAPATLPSRTPVTAGPEEPWPGWLHCGPRAFLSANRADSVADVPDRGRRSVSSLYAEPRRVMTLDECHYYHTIELPEIGLVRGDWDLREGEAAYLGGVELAKRSVLEIGPASGFMTAYMESRGATVTAVELGTEDQWDIVPQRTHDLSDIWVHRPRIMDCLRNSFWLTHRLFGLTARLHEGSAYALPRELGRFDVAVMGSILLHTRSPLSILERLADQVDDALVITERHYSELGGMPICRLEPTAENAVWDTWWAFSPDFFVAFAGVLGFPHTEVSFHEQTHRHGEGYLQEIRMPMFTVVARRREPQGERSAGPSVVDTVRRFLRPRAD
jgi:hypothetical protein